MGHDNTAQRNYNVWLYPQEADEALRIMRAATHSSAIAMMVRKAVLADKERVERQVVAGIPGATEV